MTTMTEQHDRRSLALELIRRKLRTPIIHLHTQIPLADIRDWYREIHGRSPSSGLLPSMSTLLPNRNSHIYVSLFAAIYRRVGGKKVLQVIDIHAMMEAWDLFSTLTRHVRRKRPADLTEAWVIARAMRAKTATMHRCSKCASSYLVAGDSKLPPACPICFAVRQVGKSGRSNKVMKRSRLR
jgi:hypothetical protein